jgi:hypothetical protein
MNKWWGGMREQWSSVNLRVEFYRDSCIKECKILIHSELLCLNSGKDISYLIWILKCWLWNIHRIRTNAIRTQKWFHLAILNHVLYLWHCKLIRITRKKHLLTTGIQDECCFSIMSLSWKQKEGFSICTPVPT